MPPIEKLALLSTIRSRQRRGRLFLVVLCCGTFSLLLLSTHSRHSSAAAQDSQGSIRGQSQEDANRKSAGCISCHTSTDEPTMHPSKAVYIGCTDCHGGNAGISVSAGASPASVDYSAAKEKAHVQPRDPIFKDRSAIPERAYTKWLE
jgi:hypothetical protein